MATDHTAPDAIERLNALIDGELPPAEHAALADRIAAGRDLAHAHATLARLKACIVENAEQAPSVEFALPRAKFRIMPVLGAAAAAAAVLLTVWAWYPDRQSEPAPFTEIAPFVTLAS